MADRIGGIRTLSVMYMVAASALIVISFGLADVRVTAGVIIFGMAALGMGPPRMIGCQRGDGFTAGPRVPMPSDLARTCHVVNQVRGRVEPGPCTGAILAVVATPLPARKAGAA